jgi:ATP adenylyltransferase
MSEHLWAPWRFDYVKQADDKNSSGCIFCDFPSRTDDREVLLLHRGNSAFVLLNAYPYTSGHLMVAPYKHGQDIGQLNDTELLEINQLVKSAVSWVTEVYKPDGFNIGVNMGRAAGAGIPKHIHWHVVPRWEGDTNFMTTVGEVRVIPQDLRQSWDALRAVIL